MAIIYSYPEVTSLQATDRFIISRFPSGSGEISNYNLDLDTLSTYINTGQATVTQVNDRVVTGASFNTGSGLLTLTRNSGDIPSVTTNLDGRYYLSSNPNSYTSNLGVVQSLTTNLTSGAATLVGGVLNIPQYSGSGGITEITTTTPITGGTITTTGTIGITQASGSADGYLSSTDWNTFNSKSTFDGQFSSLSNKPTTIAGYGITDALQLGVTATTALAGNTVIPAAYTNADVDAHLNTSTAGNNEVLSWTGSDYDWVAQSGGGGGVTSIIAGTGIGVDQSTGDVTITNTGSATGAYATVTRTFSGNELVNAFNGTVGDEIVLVTVPAGYQGILSGDVIVYVDYSTGTTNYAGSNLSLRVNSITGVNQVALSDTQFTNSSFPLQITNGQTDVNQVIGTSNITGKNITLISNGTSLRANFTAGDRDVTISFTYRLINLNL